MQKIIVFIFSISLFVTGCTSRTEETNEQTTPEIEEVKTESQSIDLPEQYIGFWISEAYFNALKQTKSTKKAGDMEVDDFYKISGDNTIVKMNIHEGGASNIIRMTSEVDGQIFNPDATKAYAKVTFKEGYMFVGTKKYIYTKNNENGFRKLVNSAFISGEYRLGDTKVVFKNDGTITGLGKAISYQLNLDYNDEGMEYDKIYIQYKNEPKVSTYLYSVHGDTLIISAIDCLVPEGDYCTEVAVGKTVYQLIQYKKENIAMTTK